MHGERSLGEVKPGWLARIFGIETARLIACDARWTGDTWERGDRFRFLYRSRRSKFIELNSIDAGANDWKILTEADARALWLDLPVKLGGAAEAFAAADIPPVARSRDEDEDRRIYKVVRNDKWEFALWLDYKELPRGWSFIGISGSEHECCEFIEQNCVFGAPNPGLP